MSGRWRWLSRAAGALLLGPWVALGVCAASKDVPPELLAGAGPNQGEVADRNSVRITDRTGTLLAELRDEQGKRQRRLALPDFGPIVPSAVIAAEDGRFYTHVGVDPLATSRALFTSLARARVVSGASTLTQQLARVLVGAPRTWRGKLDVMALALRIEAELPKRRILEEYLNRIEFGPNVQGVEAAAWTYFDKPASALSLAEAALLASVPRGPTLYDPRRNPGRLLERRDWVLSRMLELGLATEDEVRVAKAELFTLSPRFRSGSAPHFVQAVRSGRVDPCGAALPLPDAAVEVRTTLIADLQREITEAARATVRELEPKGVSAAAVVVLDNRSGDVLAYVGSPDAADVARLGGNDGVAARRQPGSTLKPFVYELGFEQLGLTPATVMPDVETSFTTAGGDPYRPRNYDQRFHGPVLARDALGNSLNVPAVWLTDRLGPQRVLERLRAVGLCSLTESSLHYGVAIALGDGEVSLFELATAYAVLARGGELRAPRAVLSIELAGGGELSFEPAPERRILARDASDLVVHILRDPRARSASFGERTVFDLPFEVAAKTGTSKGFRDNWAVGFTPELTVAVWVGNFDGSAMRGVSGISGAGPLFRSAMLAAARYVPASPFALPSDAREAQVCSLSGLAAGALCSHTRRELVPRDASLAACDFHESVRVDTKSGLRAGPACTTDVEERVFERFPPAFVPWARSVGRDLAPETFPTRCPGELVQGERDELRVLYPEDGARFFIDTRASHINVRAVFPAQATDRGFRVDGRAVAADAQGSALITLAVGEHSVVATASGRTSATVSFHVE